MHEASLLPSQPCSKAPRSKAELGLPGKSLPQRVAVTPILESPGTGMERRSEGIVHPGTLGSCRGQVRQTGLGHRCRHTNLIAQTVCPRREERNTCLTCVSYPLGTAAGVLLMRLSLLSLWKTVCCRFPILHLFFVSCYKDSLHRCNAWS